MKKLVSVIALVLVLALLCCGCAPRTPEELVERMNAAMAKTPCSQMESEVNFDMTMDMGVLGAMEMDMRMLMAMTVCQDPMGIEMDMLLDMTVADEQLQTEAKSYLVMEDGALVNYTCSEDQWVKMTAEEDFAAMTESMDGIDLTGATLTMDEALTEYEGVKVYGLNVVITGDSVENVLGSAMQGSDTLGTLGDIDWSALSCEGKIYVDAKTYLPVAQEMTITGMDTAMAAAFEATGVTVEIGEFAVNAWFRNFEPQSAIELPAEAAGAVEYESD